MRWKYTCASVTGKAHTRRGENGQDSSRAGTIQISDSEFFIGIAADGAGSTSDGGKGAEITCEMLYTQISETLRKNGDLSGITDDDVKAWITAARDAIIAETQPEGKPLREYACTILGSVAGNGGSVFFQIGDGAIVTGSGTDYRTIFWPEQGEYANTTYFITDEQYLDHLHILHAELPDEIALFTDGLQNLVLSFALQKAHPGFFQPLFSALGQHPVNGSQSFSTQLENFLCRDDISERSDDDKTLVLAVRMTG
ncbi:MAG: PP2C family serine/threonine-protein phosphatase [Methanoregula sp.]